MSDQNIEFLLEQLRRQMNATEILQKKVKQLEAENQVLLTYHSEVHDLLREHEKFPDYGFPFGRICDLTNDTLHRLGDIPRETE